eukprot:11932769-Prorocentrum_lima.AAC.1
MVCTDGAALEPSNPAVRRAGWAVTSPKQDGSFVACFGPLPLQEAPAQTVREAEDYALYQALLRCQGPA